MGNNEIREEIEEHLQELSKCLKGSPPLLVVALTLALEAVEQQCNEVQLALAKQLTEKMRSYVSAKTTIERKEGGRGDKK